MIDNKMKVLWFSPTPAMYSEKIWGHNGGGWIISLQKIIMKYNAINLAIVFDSNSNLPNKEFDGVKYFPVNTKKRFTDKWFKNKVFDRQIEQALKVIEDFKPDVIQLFGSEKWYGMLANYTNIPIVVHMQGSLPSYYNARYPAGMSVWNKIFSFKSTLKQKIMAFRIDYTFHKSALLEEQVLKTNKFFMGRTHWDKAIVNFYNPNAKYFVCQEALREVFINSNKKWSYKKSEKLKLISVISGPLYKGVDVILKTAKLLKTHTNIDFEWNICGTKDISFFEEFIDIDSKEVNIHTLGVISQDHLLKELLASSFYVHPSYVDNSPNSVCEAQILGLPIIATNVGGVASLIEDGITGFLVPANDPLMIASLLKKNSKDKALLESISENAISTANTRHNKSMLKQSIIDIYQEISEL